MRDEIEAARIKWLAIHQAAMNATANSFRFIEDTWVWDETDPDVGEICNSAAIAYREYQMLLRESESAGPAPALRRPLSETERKRREQAVSDHIRKRREAGDDIRQITRDSIAKATGIPATFVSGSRAWTALSAERKQAMARSVVRRTVETPDEIVGNREYDELMKEAQRTGDWSEAKRIADRQLKKR